ncbi:MAG: hypothetical protein QOI59_1303 [Gammaproteobacteria bacterium]|nr:hypothetical protein [Gammaproteobacteria bacterium]
MRAAFVKKAAVAGDVRNDRRPGQQAARRMLAMKLQSAVCYTGPAHNHNRECPQRDHGNCCPARAMSVRSIHSTAGSLTHCRKTASAHVRPRVLDACISKLAPHRNEAFAAHLLRSSWISRGDIWPRSPARPSAANYCDSTANSPTMSRPTQRTSLLAGFAPVFGESRFIVVIRSGRRVPSGGQVAQLVEQRTENPRVGGSIPPVVTTLIAKPQSCRDFVHAIFS